MFLKKEYKQVLERLISDPRMTEPKWWDEYFEVIDTMRGDIAKLTQTTNQQQQQLQLATEQVEQAHQQLQEMEPKVHELMELRARKQSEEPWIDIMGGDVDPNKGIQLQMDWNDAFIDQLRANGYTGSSESELVSQWLGQVYGMISNDIRQSDMEE